jgi:hypothetical protein
MSGQIVSDSRNNIGYMLSLEFFLSVSELF